jgi:tetratricopeptide (TPR) repeat protein
MLRRANLDSATASMEANDAQDCLKRFQAWIEASETKSSNLDDFNSQYELALYYNEIGVAYGMNGMYALAIDHLLKSIEYFQSMSDYDDTLLSWPEPNLGFMYWVQGRFEEAKQVLLEILQVQEDAWGPDDQKTFKSVNNLSCTILG